MGVLNAKAQENIEINCGAFGTEELCISLEECTWKDATCEPKITEEEFKESIEMGTIEEEGDETPDSEIVIPGPSKKQMIITEEKGDGWIEDGLNTAGIRFLIRGKEALGWSLEVQETGFGSEAIEKTYLRVLTIINSLFILGLLAIAAMWMFSLVIPRHYLKRVILFYAGAVIFVNFALPVNKLLIEGTNLLQKTLMTSENGKVTVTDIVQTPGYEEAKAYRRSESKTNEKTITLTMSEGGDESQPIGTISSENVISGNLSGSMENQSIVLALPEGTIKLNPQQIIRISENSEDRTYSEQGIFTFFMLIATGIAYFLLSLIFILRIVMLWSLLILSPVFLLLVIFKTTRGWFKRWLSLYGKWLLIGPLTALGIAMIIEIWQTAGMPIQSGYDKGIFNGISNIIFYLPGKETPNDLGSTNEMMEYMVFLIMLYLPIIFAFLLTRKKSVENIVTIFSEKLNRKQQSGQIQMTEEKVNQNQKSETRNQKSMDIMGGLKDFVNSNIAKATQLPVSEIGEKMKEKIHHPMPTASSLLPEELKLTDMHGMLELMGANDHSRRSRNKAIEKLANPEKISEPSERKNVLKIREEIERRAESGDLQAGMMITEIREKETNGIGVTNENVGVQTSSIPEAIETKTSETKVEEKSERVEKETKTESERIEGKRVELTATREEKEIKEKDESAKKEKRMEKEEDEYQEIEEEEDVVEEKAEENAEDSDEDEKEDKEEEKEDKEENQTKNNKEDEK